MIRKTTDGGETWEPIWMDEHDSYELAGVSFVDELNGWICAYLDGVFRTTDGGNTWGRLTSFDPPSGGPSRDLKFTTPDSGWVVGGIAGDQSISRTTDGGQTWEYSGASGGSSLREIQMLDSYTGWTAGSVNGPPYIARTTDGGDSWIDQAINPPNFGFESICMVTENLGWVVGESGSVYKTSNGGTTWVSPEPELPDQFMLAQNYPNPFNAWTVFRFRLPAFEDLHGQAGITAAASQSGITPARLNGRSGGDYGFVSLQIVDLPGREVATIVNERLSPGTYTRQWDASGLPSGVYFYRLQAGGFVETKKLVLLR